MTAQDTFVTAFDQFSEIGKGVELDATLLELAAGYRASIADFEVLIPLVGSFNVGKTSLVNAWLKRPEEHGLPTDIVPQTALATEIRAASSAGAENIELYGEDDNVLKKVDIGQFKAFETEALKTGQPQARYAKALLYSEHLNQSDRKVLVDMPGLDSGLRTHNAAIQRYLPLGSYFVLVVDADRGALRESEIRQLREFLEQEVEFAVLVNKIDRKASDADAIVDHIQGQLRGAFGKPAPVHTVSAHSDDVRAFADLLAGVDFHRALTTFWRSRALALFNEAERSLHTRYSALNVSAAEADRVIAELQESKEKLEDKLRREEREIGERYSNRAVDRIVRDVRDAIRGQASQLADVYLEGGEAAFQREVNEIARQTLNRTVDAQQSDTLQEMLRSYEADIDYLNISYRQFESNYEERGTFEVKPLVEKAKEAWAASAEVAAKAKKDTSEETSEESISRAASIASIVVPCLEVILNLLPSVIGFFSGRRRREEQAQQQRQNLEMRIRTDVASKVASELRPTVSDGYAKVAGGMIEQLRQHVGAHVAGVERDINTSREEIEAKQHTADQRKNELRAAIGALTKAKQPLEVSA